MEPAGAVEPVRERAGDERPGAQPPRAEDGELHGHDGPHEPPTPLVEPRPSRRGCGQERSGKGEHAAGHGCSDQHEPGASDHLREAMPARSAMMSACRAPR